MALVWPLTARAQGGGGYEVEVYNSLIAPTGAVMLELHTNYTFMGQTVPVFTGGSQRPPVDDALLAVTCARPPVYFDLVPSMRQGASASGIAALSARCTNESATSHIAHQTLEATTGVTSWSEVAMYVFGGQQPSQGFDVGGGSLRSKVRIPDSWAWPVGLALSTEVEYDRPSLSSDEWSLELRPIIDRAIGRWYASINPTVTRTLVGAGVINGIQFSPSAKVSYDVTQTVSGGVEYYGAYGPLTHAAPTMYQVQQLYAVVDLHVSPLWELNAGVGTGMTQGSDHLVAKLIVGRSLAWHRPSVTQ